MAAHLAGYRSTALSTAVQPGPRDHTAVLVRHGEGEPE
jgi:hypothetical protein